MAREMTLKSKCDSMGAFDPVNLGVAIDGWLLLDGEQDADGTTSDVPIIDVSVDKRTIVELECNDDGSFDVCVRDEDNAYAIARVRPNDEGSMRVELMVDGEWKSILLAPRQCELAR